MQVGFAEFTLPMIYAAVYPVIIISRKQELRERYMEYIRQAARWCCRSCHENDADEGENTALLVEELD